MLSPWVFPFHLEIKIKNCPMFDPLILGHQVFFLDLLSFTLVQSISVTYEKRYMGNKLLGSCMAEVVPSTHTLV